MTLGVVAEPLFQKGLAEYQARDFDAAKQTLSQAVDSDPNDSESRHVLALCLGALGELTEAVVHLSLVTSAQPQNAEAWTNCGSLLRDLGRFEEARSCQEKAIGIDPENGTAWNNMGTVLFDMGLKDQGTLAFEASIKVKPDYGAAYANLSLAKYEAGKVGEARQLARTAIALDPGLAESHNRLSFCLSAAGDVEGSLAAMKSASKAEPTSLAHSSNLMLRALSSDKVDAYGVRDYAEAWGRLRESRAARESWTPSVRKSKPSKDKPVIGFVSGDFHRHPVGYFVTPLMENIDKEVTLVCYSSCLATDDVTARIKNTVFAYHEIHKAPAEQVCDQIEADQVDVLIDLSGHTANNRLDVFGLRPAGHQVTWLGYSATTGLPQMDSIVLDPILAPEGHEDRYTESVLRLPGTFLCYEPPDFDPVGPEAGGPVTFGVFNNPSKYSDSCYRTWSEVLKSCPGSRLVIKYHRMDDSWVKNHILGRFEDEGLSPDRIEFWPFVKSEDNLETISRIHVALDTFPYTGATTTLDCLGAGVPVITLEGDRYAARMSASLLTACGLESYVTETKDEYVETALRLADERSRGKALSQDLRARFLESRICDPERFAKEFLATVLS
ncbi:MAG: tetratricopeptide repeat protein [Chthonomonadaceae bacterium]|nr:tetratricopeptide repeat protein [Chthonomonadaceae bacterium]